MALGRYYTKKQLTKFTYDVIEENGLVSVDEMAQARLDIATTTLVNYTTAFALALNNSEGYGTKRLNRVLKSAFSNLECIKTGNLKIEDLDEWMKEMKLEIIMDE